MNINHWGKDGDVNAYGWSHNAAGVVGAGGSCIGIPFLITAAATKGLTGGAVITSGLSALGLFGTGMVGGVIGISLIPLTAYFGTRWFCKKLF